MLFPQSIGLARTSFVILLANGIFMASRPFYLAADAQRPLRFNGDVPANIAAVLVAGTPISVTYGAAHHIFLTRQESLSLSLSVTTPITHGTGRVLIPVNSQIVGELVPAGQGSQFIAQTLLIQQGKRAPLILALSATSAIIERTISLEQVHRQAGSTNIAMGNHAAALLASRYQTDPIATATIPIPAKPNLGPLTQWLIDGDPNALISIYPHQDLRLTLQADLLIP